MASSKPGDFMKFKSIQDAIDSEGAYLQRKYFNQGINTLGRIWNVHSEYSPIPGEHAANDKYDTNKQWGPQVAQRYQDFGGTDPAFLPGSVGNQVKQIQDAYSKSGVPLPSDLQGDYPIGPESESEAIHRMDSYKARFQEAGLPKPPAAPSGPIDNLGTLGDESLLQ
jgi:hypothetical protein